MLGNFFEEESAFMGLSTAFVGLEERMSQRMAPTCDWTDMGSDAHFVQFFESDSYFVNEVSEFLLHGLRTGETCIAVATKEHLKGIDAVIKKHARHLKGGMDDWHFIALDAPETLSKLVTEGV